MTPTFFVNQLDFRKWLEKNHQTEKELLVGFYKVHTFEYEKVSFIALVFYWNSGFICTIAQDYSKTHYLG